MLTLTGLRRLTRAKGIALRAAGQGGLSNFAPGFVELFDREVLNSPIEAATLTYSVNK